ncbi:S-layer homology domain-containing protein [Brevibacillus migulae]|uniref:S-layer homology domain-containing protein n=1 Tax=Brevibacillus migulae TaxID=1644114 RepID=UPI00106E36D0|nr:S-layer homology domain-containing protein [Brevibacillus migulae]
MQKRKMWKATAGLLLCALLAPQSTYAEEEVYIPFTDIWSHWAKKSIFRTVEEGMFAESKDGHFYPDRLMTRAEYLVLLDRLFLRNQQQLQPLSLLSESFLLGREDDFENPSLPYTDVNRLTWMYRPILRASLFMETLYGPDALHQVFPGKELQPAKPITKGEAARLLQVFVGAKDNAEAWQEITTRSWLNGKETDPLTRAESAVLADQVISLVDADGLLPTLDVDGTKYPLVPDIRELFPLFATYTEWKTADDDAYLQAVEAIRNRADDEKTYETLTRLSQTDYPNKVGIYYYLSWNPNTPLEDNLTNAFSALDAYFADRIVLPDTMRLLVANIYDIILQMQSEDKEIFEKTLDRLHQYESKMKKGTKEWEAFSIYLAAMEANRGDLSRTIAAYREVGETSESLRNIVYYLISQERIEEAEQELNASAGISNSPEFQTLKRGILQDLTQLKDQDSIANHLTFVLGHFQQQQDYRVEGTAALNGFRFKYWQDIDQDRQVAHTTGYYQSPRDLVLQKMESYVDAAENVEYIHHFDEQSWSLSQTNSNDYMHEWIEKQSIRTRVHELQARYEMQSFGSYDIITEWIPGDAIVEKAGTVSLENGRVVNVPLFINKYYIDRVTDQLIAHQWRYEEIYDSRQYVSYIGKESYTPNQAISIYIPEEVRKEVNNKR